MIKLPFVARKAEMDKLDKELSKVVNTSAGRLVVLKGKRRLGKSRLAQEFIDSKTNIDNLFYNCTKENIISNLENILNEIKDNDVLFANDLKDDNLTISSWNQYRKTFKNR